MGAISQRSAASWYDNGGNAWASHAGMELTAAGRKGRIQFGTLSGGMPITALSFQFDKTNSGGGGTFTLYATDNANLLPNDMAGAVYVGALSGWGAGTGTKTVALSETMASALRQFTGTWYLLMQSSVYVTFTGGSGSSAPLFTGEYQDGSVYINIAGVYRLGQPLVNVGGVWRGGVQQVNAGGIWRDGKP